MPIDSNLTPEGLAIILASAGARNVDASTGTSLALTTTRSVGNPTVGENGDIGPPYSGAVVEMLHRARISTSSRHNHTYSENLQRGISKTSRRDLEFDPVANKAEWKAQAR